MRLPPKTMYSPDMSTSLVHGDGTVFLNLPDVTATQGVNLNHPDTMFTRHMQSGQIANVISGTVRSSGAQRMMAMFTLQPSELHMDNALVVAVGRDLSGIYRPWLRQTELYASVFILLAAGSCALLFALQRRRMALDAQAAAARTRAATARGGTYSSTFRSPEGERGGACTRASSGSTSPPAPPA